MSGLVAYESSEEDDEVLVPQPKTAQKSAKVAGTKTSTEPARVNGSEEAPSTSLAPAKATGARQDEVTDGATSEDLDPPPGPVMGPALGPTMPPSTEVTMLGLESQLQAEDTDEPPKSPFSASRSLLRDLTLPVVPNMDIPPSPTGTPPPGLEALNQKFENFLELKRKKGVHFNERLAGSSAAKNPGLMDKLLGFVGIETEFENDRRSRATSQYATTLPTDLWDPNAFPDWAFKGPLRKSQEKIQKDKERMKGEAVDFVPASASAPLSQPGSRSGTPGFGGGAPPPTGKRKSRFDT